MKSSKCNLMRDELEALKKLMKNKNRLMSKADKGDTTVVMSPKQYLHVVMEFKHLNDPNTYQPLETDPTQEIAERFNAYLNLCQKSRRLPPYNTTTCNSNYRLMLRLKQCISVASERNEKWGGHRKLSLLTSY